jgi:hypothetical protein
MKYLMWLNLILGAWLIGSPFAFGYSASRPSTIAADMIPGLFLVATSCWILLMRTPHPRVEWTQALCGLWLVIGSFVLLFSGIMRGSLNDLIVGFVVVATSLVASSAAVRQRT